jgi:putative hydrolase of the HAD superfamily
LLIIFDLDDTLIDTTGSITPIQLEKALHQMVHAGLKVGNFEEALATLKRMDLSSESASQTIKEFLELVDGDPALLPIGENIVYGDLPQDLTVFPLESAIEVLDYLKESHQLALVSMGKPHQQRLKMKSAGLDSTIFSKIVISEREDKRSSYQEVLEELNVTPERTVVCGDRVKRDLTPAKALGCRTIQMQWGRGRGITGSLPDVDFTIRRLTQIKEIIEGL